MDHSLSGETAGSKSQRTHAVTHSNLLSAICYLLFHSSLAARMNCRRQDLLGDLRVRHGIKLGLGGLLAMFCAQALRLPDDQWAILTLLVLMNGQYVGAFAFKGVMRMTGTTVGAVVGVWLVSNYASTPAIFLLLFFVVMALAGYKYGQVGARQRPYVYFLVGLTTITVAGDAITTPGKAWQFGLYRTEEIFVGIVCSLLVSNLVWPRYAREEFFEAGRAALKTVSQLFSIHALTYISAGDASFEDATVPRLRAPRTSSGPSQVEQLHYALDQQFARLRNLLQAGARESAVFSARLENYNAFMVSLNNLFHAGLALHRHRGELWFLEHLRSEIESVFAAISREFEIVTGPASPGEKLPPSLINETFARFEERVNQIRAQGILLKAPLGTALDFAGEFALLRRVRDELNDVRAAVEGLPRRFGPSSPDDSPEAAARLNSPRSLAISEKRHWPILRTIDWFWVKAGIKGGLAALIAIVFLRWIHPPGAANVPTWAWIFTILRGGFFRVGSGSDLRSFRTAVCGSLFLAGCTFLLIIITPLLASYTVMNLVLFLVLFATGFFTAKYTAISFWSEFTFLTLSALVALNPQVPVSSQTIIIPSLEPSSACGSRRW